MATANSAQQILLGYAFAISCANVMGNSQKVMSQKDLV